MDSYETGAGVHFPRNWEFVFWESQSPAPANRFADPTIQISHFPVVHNLMRGDIVAWPGQIHGHMAIYIRNGMVIQAGMNDVTITPIDPGYTIRRYTW